MSNTHHASPRIDPSTITDELNRIYIPHIRDSIHLSQKFTRNSEDSTSVNSILILESSLEIV